jgi:hypothetical protein
VLNCVSTKAADAGTEKKKYENELCQLRNMYKKAKVKPRSSLIMVAPLQ